MTEAQLAAFRNEIMSELNAMNAKLDTGFGDLHIDLQALMGKLLAPQEVEEIRNKMKNPPASKHARAHAGR